MRNLCVFQISGSQSKLLLPGWPHPGWPHTHAHQQRPDTVRSSRGNKTGLRQPLLLSPTGYGKIHPFDFVFIWWRVQWTFSHRWIHPACHCQGPHLSQRPVSSSSQISRSYLLQIPEFPNSCHAVGLNRYFLSKSRTVQSGMPSNMWLFKF